MDKVALVTNIAPHYRAPLWERLVETDGLDVYFYFGKGIGSIKEIQFEESKFWKDKSGKIKILNNKYIKKRLVFQTGFRDSFFQHEWKTIIILGDPNIISNWIIALYARFKGIPIIFWGHGLYACDKNLKNRIRKMFLSLANHHLLYGNYAKSILMESGFNNSEISVVYNSLDYEQALRLRKKSIIPNYFRINNIFKNDNSVLVFIGRLTPQKKIPLLLEAANNLKNRDLNFNVLIVGEGEEKNHLFRLAEKLEIPVYFYGAEYDEIKIAELLTNSYLCVSPGEVGLTAVHSLSYGTPVCTHNRYEEQMPEFEAIIEGETGFFYDLEKENLSLKIEEWFTSKTDRENIRENCYKIIDTYYNPNYQLKVIREAITKLI